MSFETTTGVEWVIDATGCGPDQLRDMDLIRSVCDRVIRDLNLNVVGLPLCHRFPSPGGVTALYLLSESHLACHTYPEHHLATFNLYCCRVRDGWDWQKELATSLSAQKVTIRRLERGVQ
ncbi:MAG: S-adenosylmethionine decarboxylase family protein [Rubripirellula sp.]